MTDMDNRVASPCVRNCCLNDDDVCLGCFRSLTEICAWSRADDQTRLNFLAKAEQRCRQRNIQLAAKQSTGDY